jgi:uncharacterized protein YjbI with pentapeptide repeats
MMSQTVGTRRRRGPYARLAWATVLVAGLLGASNGESAPASRVLPFGSQDPHAVTEAFIARHPDAALDVRHVAILTLEPAGTSEGDTGHEEATDRVPYAFDRALRIRLQLDASADRVGRLVLKDDHGREVACLERKIRSRRPSAGRCGGHSAPGADAVRVRPGTYSLELHHARTGEIDAPVQRVFVRSRLPSRPSRRPAATGTTEPPAAGATVGLEASADCEHCDFANADLESQDFSGATLSGSTFTSALLEGTNFNGATMLNCLLTGPPAGKGLFQTTFVGANLTGAHFDGAAGDQADFSGATLDQTTWGPQTTQTDSQGTVALPTVMTNATFSGAKVRNALFNGTLLDGSTFASATLASGFRTLGAAVSFPAIALPTSFPNVSAGYLQTWCRGCRFDGATILGTTFDGANLTSATFVRAVIKNTTFNLDALQRPTDLSHVVLTGAQLDGVDLLGTTLTGVDLSVIAPGAVIDADFSGDVTGANLSDFDFTGFNLSHGDLSGAILSAQSLATLAGATLSDGTAHGITLAGIVFPSGFAGFRGKDLRFANLTGATLDGADLSAANLANATLTDTRLAQGNLEQTNLAESSLQGAVLDFANLDGADLRGASLNKSPTTLVAARLNGAFLRNANLASANASGASFISTNFYSSICVGGGACECPPASWSPTSPTCASATGATMTAAVFTGAYLSGVDMSGATLQAAHFDQGAVLVGVNFNGAVLSQDPNGNPALFNGAFLQGANFTNAIVTAADFTSAYVDLTSANGATMTFLLDGTHTHFTGYWATSATGACVQATYGAATTLPPTDNSNVCPDGVTTGPCSDAAWAAPQVPIGNAQPPPSVCQPGSCQCALPSGGSIAADLTWILP